MVTAAWYDPSHRGEGWLVEILANGQALLAWFSYDSEGRQAWFYNVGATVGNTITVDLLMPSGTDFGPTFDPDDLNLSAWGTAIFTFDSCNSGSMTYDSPLPGYGSGSIGLSRLTSLSGLECHQLKQKYYKEVSKEVRTPMNGTRLSYFSMNI